MKNVDKINQRQTNLIPKEKEKKRSATHKDSQSMLRIQAKCIAQQQNPKTKTNFGERLSVWKTKLWTFFLRYHLNRHWCCCCCWCYYISIHGSVFQFHSFWRIFFYAAIKPNVNLYIFQHSCNRTTSSCGPGEFRVWCTKNQFQCWLPLLLSSYFYCKFFIGTPFLLFLCILFVRVFFSSFVCVCLLVKLPQLTEASIRMSVCTGRAESNKREMIRKSIKQKHVFITHQCKHRFYFFDGIQLNGSFLLSSSLPSPLFYSCTFFFVIWHRICALKKEKTDLFMFICC